MFASAKWRIQSHSSNDEIQRKRERKQQKRKKNSNTAKQWKKKVERSRKMNKNKENEQHTKHITLYRQSNIVSIYNDESIFHKWIIKCLFVVPPSAVLHNQIKDKNGNCRLSTYFLSNSRNFASKLHETQNVEVSTYFFFFFPFLPLIYLIVV